MSESSTIAPAEAPADCGIAATLTRVLLPRDDQPGTTGKRSFAIAAGTSGLVVALLFASMVEGALSLAAFIALAASVAAAVGAFHLAFLTGLNRRASDPSLTLHQIVVASTIVFWALCLAKVAAAGMLLVVLVMIFMFGVLRLRTGTMLRLALYLLAAYAAAIALHWRLDPAADDVHAHRLQWLTLAVTLPWFALMGGYVGGLRDRLRRSVAIQREQLAEIRASELRLADVQRIAGLGHWTVDLATGVIEWSADAFRIFGFDPARGVPTGAEFIERVHPEDRAAYREVLRRAHDARSRFGHQYRLRAADGAVRWVEVAGEPITDGDRPVARMRGSVIDVTARKEQEAAIVSARDQAAAARATLIDAIEMLPEAFALFDAGDRLVLCNERYVQWFTGGTRVGSLLGTSFADIVRISIARGEAVPARFGGDVERYVRDRVEDHRRPGATPREVQLGDGRWVEVAERRTSSGGVVGVRADVTARKEVERRQAMDHAVTRVLAEARTVDEAMHRVIRTIAEAMGWAAGARWSLHPGSGLLHCAEIWGAASDELASFVLARRAQSLPQGEEDPVRRALAAAACVWIPDLGKLPAFAVAPEAARAGLSAGLAFPVRSGGRAVAVMEFFLREPRQPDPALVEILEALASQLGQFLERMAAQDELRRLAHYDRLTGLPNRAFFREMLSRALARATRKSAPLAVLFIDLDGFKAVNDTCGHAAGDDLLVAFAQRLRGCLREGDNIARAGGSPTAARLGGDEFVVMLDDLEAPADAAAVAERILAATAEPFLVGGDRRRVTASVGIAVHPGDGDDADALVEAADHAMYRVKRSGRNACRFNSSATLAAADG